MGWTRLSKLKMKLQLRPGEKSDESGIALFMVIAAMTILSVVVTEFTYVAQVNARSTIDSSDQIKAHYLAKTGFKISLLRLRAFKELKSFGKKGSGLPELPKSLLDQIWSFPFFFPVPAGVPGLTLVMKEEIAKFQEESTLPGKFTATIESESNKIGINSILKSMAPSPAPAATPKKGATQIGNDDDFNDDGLPPPPLKGGNEAKKKEEKYSVEEARKGFKEFLSRLLEDKFKADPDFADMYRDLEVDDLYDNILGWIDFTYQPKNARGLQPLPYKRAPIYSMSELHMIRPIDDGLFDLIAPNFTPFTPPGINVNKIQSPMLRAILVGITDQEVEDFFKFRDDPEVDNTFKTPEDFYKWVGDNVASLRASKADELKGSLAKQGIKIIMDEEIFKITVVAEVNKATRILEAWVLLSSQTSAAAKPKVPGEPSPGDEGLTDPSAPKTGAAPNAAGLRILFMRES